MSKIWAIVVTFNRKDLLQECVRALLKSKVDRVLVVDNASTDGTNSLFEQGAELRCERVSYMRLRQNEGGAGGFYWGTRFAYENGADWCWLMDDDVEPLDNALDRLVDASHRPDIGFVCSCVRTPDMRLSMNLPLVATDAPIGKYPSWEEWLNEGLVKVRAATFVSVMFNREAIARCGFPNRRFFIWGDDLEFTQRIVDSGLLGLLVGQSIVIHKRAQIEALSIVTEKNPHRINLMRNQYRNITWMKMQSGSIYNKMKSIIWIAKDIINILRFSKEYKRLRLGSVIKGYIAGLTQDLKNDESWSMAHAVDTLVHLS